MPRIDVAALCRQLQLSVDAPAAAAARHFASHSPIDGSLIGHVPITDAAQYERVLNDAVHAAQHWADVPAPRRGELVRLLGTELRTHQHALAELIVLESGKPLAEALGEVQEAAAMADFAAGLARMLRGRTLPSEHPQHRLTEQWHPLGVVGLISAFNFPLGVWAWNAMLALICGNACVWKPSPKTPLCALAVQRLCERVIAQTRSPAITHLLLDAGAELAQRLSADRRVALLSFTGSTAVGRQVAQTVAARLGRSLLELGGNGSVIVDDTADLALATRAIVAGAVATAGQRCTTTRRVLVHHARATELLQRLLHTYQQLRVGDPFDPATQVGPLIDAAAVHAFERSVAAALTAGGELLAGGHALVRPGHFVEPTLIGALHHWDVVQQECFAPILYLIPVESFEQALALQNQSAYALSAALFTQRLQHMELFLSHRGSDCGIANINLGTGGIEIGAAFGGEKDTGGGREIGVDAWQSYMRRQTNTINWSDRLPPTQDLD